MAVVSLRSAAEPDGRDWSFGGTWPYEPRWLSTDGIRLHYVDEGPRDGQPVVLLHGNPTWSYLYRDFIRGLVESGYRAIAYDQLGFGRSEKPGKQEEYSLARHVRHFEALASELALDGVTLLCHDWGGPIALAWAVEHPQRVRRLVLLNTFTGALPAALLRPPLLLRLLRAPITGELLVKGAHLFVRGLLFRKGLADPARLSKEARAAYLAPHPSWASRSGILAYPRLIPWDDGSPTLAIGQRIEAGLAQLAGKPVLLCWALRDPAFPAEALAELRGRFVEPEVVELEDASHFLQEDAPEQLVPAVVSFLKRS